MIISKADFQRLKAHLLPLKKEAVQINDQYQVNVIELNAAAALQLGAVEGGKTSPVDWVAACCVDDNNEPVFTKDDVRQMPVALFNTLVEAVMRLNGLAQGEKAIEEAEKNS